MKIGIIGSGAVGSACLLAIVLRGSAREIVVVNRDRKRARAIADLAGVELVMIAAGINEQNGGATDRSDPAGRLRLLETNVGVYKEILPRLAQVAPEALIERQRTANDVFSAS